LQNPKLRERAPHKKGKVHAVMHICVESGGNLAAKDSNNLSDPFVELYLDSEKLAQTVVKVRRLQSRWRAVRRARKTNNFESACGRESERSARAARSMCM